MEYFAFTSAAFGALYTGGTDGKVASVRGRPMNRAAWNKRGDGIEAYQLKEIEIHFVKEVSTMTK
jgi:hypothetical protein